MPNHLDSYFSYVTPYYETYCPDTGLWYTDDEDFPQPKQNAVKIKDFSLTPLFGRGSWHSEFGLLENDETDMAEAIQNSLNQGLQEGDYSLGLFIRWGKNEIYCAWDYQTVYSDLLKFIKTIENNKPAKFYTDHYSCQKFISFPVDETYIRLVIQDYYEEMDTRLTNIFDGIVDKKYLTLSIKSLCENAKKYLSVEVQNCGHKRWYRRK